MYCVVDGAVETRDCAGLVWESATEGHAELSQTGTPVWGKNISSQIQRKCRHFKKQMH